MKDTWNDARIEYIISYFLRAGVIIASLFVFAGGVYYLMEYGRDVPEYKIFSGEPADLRSVHGIVLDAIGLRSRAVIQLGLLLLMCTPAAWVAFLLFAFIKERDRTYIVVTVLVLLARLFSLVGRYLFA